MIGADIGDIGLAVLLTVGLGTILSAGLAVYAGRNTDAPAATAFRNLQSAAAGWGLAELTIFLAPASATWLELAYGVRFFFSALTAVLAILFLAAYTQSALLDRRALRALLLGSLAGVVVLWVLNPGELAYEALEATTFQGITVVVPTFGTGTAAYFVFVYGFFAFAFLVLGSFMLESANPYQQQTGLVFFAFLLVVIGTLLTVFGYTPHEGVDFGPMLNAVGGSIIWVAIYGEEFLSVAPLANEAIVETIANPVLVVDDENALVYANESAATVGVRGKARGRSIEELLPGLEKAIEEETVYRYEPEADGAVTTHRAFEPRVQRLVDHHGLDRGSVVVLHEVTERERREQRLDEFASLVSHDLRNPLNVAKLRTDLAREEAESKHLEDVEDALERMENLIEDLLTAARGRDGEPEKLEVEALAREAWEYVDTDDGRLDVDSPGAVVADRGQAMELLENLFRNADEHNDGPVTVRVGSRPGGFYVADDGDGVDTDHEELFEPGFTTTDDGTGLGLYIVGQLATAQGWELAVDDSADGGLRFDIVTEAG